MRRSSALRSSHVRASVPPMKPIMTPKLPSSGDVSNVAFTGTGLAHGLAVQAGGAPERPVVDRFELHQLPCGMRCVSWSRRAGSAGSYAMRLASAGGIAITTRWRAHLEAVGMTVTSPLSCAMRATGFPSSTRPARSDATRMAISCAPPTKRCSCARRGRWK